MLRDDVLQAHAPGPRRQYIAAITEGKIQSYRTVPAATPSLACTSSLPRPARLHEALLRLRRLGDKGTLQLAIDVDSVRRALLDFPRVATSGRHAAEFAAAAAAAGRGAVLGGADRAQPVETVSNARRALPSTCTLFACRCSAG